MNEVNDFYKSDEVGWWWASPPIPPGGLTVGIWGAGPRE